MRPRLLDRRLGAIDGARRLAERDDDLLGKGGMGAKTLAALKTPKKPALKAELPRPPATTRPSARRAGSTAGPRRRPRRRGRNARSGCALRRRAADLLHEADEGLAYRKHVVKNVSRILAHYTEEFLHEIRQQIPKTRLEAQKDFFEAKRAAWGSCT